LPERLVQQFLIREPPQAHGLVESAGDGEPCVGRERHAGDAIVVSGEANQLAAAVDVPETDGFVAAGRKKLAAIRGKYGRVDPAPVTVDVGQAATVPHAPKIEAMLSASGTRAGAVGRKGDVFYGPPPRLGEPLAAGTQFPAAVNVPEPQTV